MAVVDMPEKQKKLSDAIMFSTRALLLDESLSETSSWYHQLTVNHMCSSMPKDSPRFGWQWASPWQDIARMHPNQRFLLQTASKTTKGFQPSTLLCEHSHPAQNMCPRLRGKFLEIKLKQQSRNSRSIVKQKGFQPSTLVCEHSQCQPKACVQGWGKGFLKKYQHTALVTP